MMMPSNSGARPAPADCLHRARIIIPTYNAAPHFAALRQALDTQGINPGQVLVIDSSSMDGTAELFREFGAEVVVIPQAQFNHGGTRRMATDMCAESEFLVFLTQDAMPSHPEALRNLVNALTDSTVGMAYGRQLPRPQARGIERHARLFNYPEGGGEVRGFEDRRRLGIKATFSSNSFAAYRRQALLAVGNFPADALFAEDQIVSGRMLMAGWCLAYIAEACVIHSHDYTIAQEFRRYFDVGVFHARNRWLLDEFGGAEGEGMRFVQSEMSYLWKHEKAAIPGAILRVFAKYLGYRMGRIEERLSLQTKARLSMSPHYWKARMKS